MNSTFVVVLDYNGGEKTDQLVSQLNEVNGDNYRIHVLDNGSDPDKKSKFITHETGENLGIGDGINCCVQLAKETGAKRLCFIVNDLTFPAGVFQIPLLEYPLLEKGTVAVSAAVTEQSNQAILYPWMIQERHASQPCREVPHVDFLFTMLDLSFLDEIGGSPEYSMYARGFDLHFAYQAKLRNRKIYVYDAALIAHTREGSSSTVESTSFSRFAEMVTIFFDEYGLDGWMEFVPHRLRAKYEIMRMGLSKMMEMVAKGATEEELRSSYKLLEDMMRLHDWISRKEFEPRSGLFR